MKLLVVICIISLLQVFCVSGADYNILRNSCFKNDEKDCNTDFVDVYKNLSRSVTGKLADTYFLLFTKENQDEPEYLHKCGGRLPPKSNFNPKNRIIFIGPSFMTNYCQFSVYRDWKDEILKKEKANVIIIDYDWEGPDYEDAHSNLRLIAKQTLVVLNNIKEQTGVSELNIMVIGISLGSQLAGYIGRFYKEDGFMLQRIIGLDPAGPDFDKVPPKEKLDPSDAKLVDVWHCNAGEMGTTYDGGHVNYYINGGTFQASCHETNAKSILEGDVALAAGTALEPSCSHIQCTKYLKESINPSNCQYVGVKCNNYEDFLDKKCKSCGPNGENCLIMGYDLDKIINAIPEKPQKYYVQTKIESPYCDNDYVDLDGYSPIYKSSLQRRPFKKNESKKKPLNMFVDTMNIITDLFEEMLNMCSKAVRNLMQH